MFGISPYLPYIASTEVGWPITINSMVWWRDDVGIQRVVQMLGYLVLAKEIIPLPKLQ